MTAHLLSVADFRTAARRHLPRFIFDFIDGGAGDETALRRNLAAFAEIELVPRVLALPKPPTLATTLWGETFEAPFGVAPMGLGELAWPGTDLGIARAASGAGVPFCVSMVASTEVERLAAIAGPRTWLQIYTGLGDAITDDLIGRAEASGVTTLLFTVDANYPGLRLRDRRNGFPAHLRRAATVFDLLAHPRWAAASWRAGTPQPVNLVRTSKDAKGASPLPAILSNMARAPLDWGTFEELRRRWRGRLLLKGVLAPADARQAKALGADGLVVSNHGARQLAGVTPSISAIPAIRSAVGPDYPLLLDSGVRRGEDVAKALVLGADLVLLGRPFLYAAAALGPTDGPARLLNMLRDETIGALAQLGVAEPALLRKVDGLARTQPSLREVPRDAVTSLH